MAFIKLDRAIVDSYCFANPNHLKVWLWLLVKANFKKNYVPLAIGRGTTTIEVDRGQLIFGRFVAEKELKMDGSMIYRILKKFKDLGQIEIESNNQYSLITICKYDSYQNNKSKSEQQMNNHCTADEQQMNNECTADEQSLNTLKEGLEGKKSKEVFIKGKKFVYEDFNELPNHLNKSVIEQTKITKQIDVTSNQVNSMWEIFKIQNLTGTKFYNNEHSVYQHFVNWIKNQNFNNGTNKSNYKSDNKSISSISSVSGANFEQLKHWADQFSDDSPNSNAK